VLYNKFFILTITALFYGLYIGNLAYANTIEGLAKKYLKAVIIAMSL